MDFIIVIAVLIAVVVTAPLAAVIAINYNKRVSEAKIGSAEEKAREIIDDALKTAESKKRINQGKERL